MKDSVITALAVGMGVAGAMIELNLMRVFVGDWMKSRRDGKQIARSSRQRTPSPKSRSSLVPCFSACAAAVLIAPQLVHAQEIKDASAYTIQPQAQPEAATESNSRLSLQLNLDATTAYFYHGINQEDTGFILQPAARLTYNLYEKEDLKLDAILGTWNSVHSRKTGATVGGDSASYWYESDLIGGVVLTSGKFSLTSTYTVLTSPSDAYKTVQELDFTLAYDDTEMLKDFALHPYATLGWEIGANGSDGGDSNAGIYLELGVAPGFTFDAGKTPVSISFPVTVGLSLHDYYQNGLGEDDTFGFASVGVKGSIPLNSEGRFKWTLNAGVSAMFFGDHVADFNSGRDHQCVGTVGLQLNF